MKIEQSGIYEIHDSERHGKACKGHKLTTSIQVREPFGEDGYLLKRSFSYPVGDKVKREAAIDKARDHIKTLHPKGTIVINKK